MFLLRLLLVFVAVPAAMIGLAAATGPAGARLVTYVLFPVGLLAFVLAVHARDRRRDGDREGGAP